MPVKTVTLARRRFGPFPRSGYMEDRKREKECVCTEYVRAYRGETDKERQKESLGLHLLGKTAKPLPAVGAGKMHSDLPSRFFGLDGVEAWPFEAGD